MRTRMGTFVFKKEHEQDFLENERAAKGPSLSTFVCTKVWIQNKTLTLKSINQDYYFYIQRNQVSSILVDCCKYNTVYATTNRQKHSHDIKN